jgi:hypothetical protein
VIMVSFFIANNFIPQNYFHRSRALSQNCHHVKMGRKQAMFYPAMTEPVMMIKARHDGRHALLKKKSCLVQQ